MSAGNRYGAVTVLVLGFAAAAAHADTIADWTFETSVPTTAGPFSPEVGAGAATGHHAGATVYSNPAGNGSTHSFSSTLWAVGDYYQFSVSTLGKNDLSLSWDQVSSGTGPRDFELEYSTNGTTFTNLAPYQVKVNGSPNPAWSTQGSPNSLFTFTEDLSSLASIDNQATVYFRLVDTDTIAANGGAVGTGGTDRVDNFTVNGAVATPLPAAVWLFGSGLLSLAGLRRRSAT